MDADEALERLEQHRTDSGRLWTACSARSAGRTTRSRSRGSG
jgi:hypothetical protein